MWWNLQRRGGGNSRRRFVPRNQRHSPGEAIPAFGDGFEELGSARAISQGSAEAVHRDVDALIVIEEFFVGPENLAKFVPADQGVGAFQEDGEQARGLFGQALVSIPARQCAGIGIEGEFSESKFLLVHRSYGARHAAKSGFL